MTLTVKQTIEAAIVKSAGNWTRAAAETGWPRTTFRDTARRLGVVAPTVTPAKVNLQGDDNACILTLRTETIRTLEGALAEGHVDESEWEVERWVLNKWDVAAKVSMPGSGETLAATELWQVKIWFRRKTLPQQSLERLLEELKKGSLRVPKLKRKPQKGKQRRALEICIMDPHLGLQCFRPGSDQAWDMDTCEQFFLHAIDDLLAKAKPYAPFDEILWVFGNDFLHTDTVFGTTTAGTPQPEAVAWHAAYDRGKKLAIAAAEKLKQAGPLKIVQISGNHDRISSYTLGHVLHAYYHLDENVTVEVNPSPYKFWNYGVNLIGLDHGHAKNLGTLAALMANETAKTYWATSRYREWHLGDQHRKGSGRPTIMAEQGVGIEFLTGLTPANSWHKIKTFNWQPRGAVAYVWNYDTGPEARLNFNIDSYSGKPMGEK